MKPNSRNAIEKLANHYKNVHSEWFSEGPTPYTAIAFYPHFPQWGNTQEIQLVIQVVKVDDKGEVQFLPKYVLDITMEEPLAPMAKGASEPIGLIPTMFANSKEGQDVIERNLSDFLVTLLDSEILKTGKETVLFQGPLSPKLLGRLGYRHFTHDITFAGITFKSEWFPLTPLEANRRLNEDLGKAPFFINIEESCDKKSKTFFDLADSRATNGLGETVKCWTLGDNEKTILVLELFCQFPSEVQPQGEMAKSSWLTKMRVVQQTLRFPGVVFDQGEPVWLPFALACAYDLCRHYGTQRSKDLEMVWRDRWEYLRFYEEDVEEMYRRGWEATEIVGRRSLLYLAAFNSKTYGELQQKVNLQVANGQFDRGNTISNTMKYERTQKSWSIERWREIA